MVKAVKNDPQERISEKIGEQIDDGHRSRRSTRVTKARRDPQACGVATTFPSDSDCIEDSGNPSGDVRRQSCGCAATMTDDDSSEESDCGTDRSSICDGLVAKLRQESSSWMGDFAGSSWRQGKSAKKWARYRSWSREGHDRWS